MENVMKFANQEDTKHLLCTSPGCGRRWSVDIERPMCSLHQWGSFPTRNEPREVTQAEIDNIKDKRFWAKRIVAQHEAGIKRPIVVVEMAKRALNVQF